jgi:photosystem II stability/assembly factor-like uncharacterized protein
MRLERFCAVLVLSIVAPAPVCGQNAALDSTFFAGMKARSIGPAGMSGRIGAIEGVPGDPNTIYVGAATGGLWKSTTGGVTWTPLTDHLPAASIGAIAVFGPSPDVVWIGTGEKARRNTAGVGTGIYKSLDAGRTWTFMGLGGTVAISEIILHPTDPDVAYVAALGNTWAESEERGVFKTTDGGTTWTKILYVNATSGAADLVMDPGNPNKLFAAMWEHRRRPWFFTSGGEGSGLYVTWDGGATWTRRAEQDGMPAGPLGRIGLDIARSNPRIVYALVEAKKSVLLRSADGGRTFTTVNRDDEIGDRPFYYQQIRVDPEDENRVYTVAGVIRLSQDGGRIFTTLLPFARVHVDHHAFWINPQDGRMIVDGNDGGVYISRDRGAGWRLVENLPLAQFYHIAVDDAEPYHVMGGLQDNGSWRGPSSRWENGGIRNYHWEEVAFGDGFATIPAPGDSRSGFGMSQGGELVRWDGVTGERKSVKPYHPDGVPLRFNWNAGIAVDPFDQAIYYGSQFVHRSVDRGDTWTIISPDLTTNDPTKQQQDSSGGLTYDVTAAENHTTILTIAPSPVERGVLWVGTDDGNVQVTRDGGATWSNVRDRIRGVPAATWVPHIEASKFDAGTAFVVFDDHRRGQFQPYLYKTTDFGRTWSSLVTPAVGHFLHVIEQDPVEPNLLFLGSEFGMYVSLDAGASWQPWTAGVPRVPVLAFVVHPREHDLVIATHGRAAYVLDDIRPLRALARDRGVAETALHVFEVPAATQHMVKQVDGYRFLADAMFVGENRPYGALLTYAVRAGSDTGKAAIEVLAADGTRLRRFSGPARSGLNRAAWDLRRDRFRRPKGDDEESEFRPAGVEVLPGTYTVLVIVGSDTARQAVEVRPDPRYAIPETDRRAKDDAVRAIGRQLEHGAEAADRLTEAMDDLTAIATRLRAREDTASRALAAGADSLRQVLTRVRASLVGPEDVQGIVRDDAGAIPALNQPLYRMLSSWDAPTDAQRREAAAAARQLREAVEATNRVFATDVAAFRIRLDAAGFRLLPVKEAIEF